VAFIPASLVLFAAPARRELIPPAAFGKRAVAFATRAETTTRALAASPSWNETKL
jgi:hypothetical protein